MAAPAEPSLAQQKLPIRVKAAYGLGTLAFGIKDQGFSALLLLYYNQVVGLPASWVGAAIMAAMIIDAMADPLIGHVSDNWSSSLGRRHPFMYASALPAAISYLLLWSPPHAAPLWQCVWLTLTAIAVRMSVSLFEVPNAALATEFTQDYEERTSLQVWRGLFIAVGGTIIALFIYKVFLVPTADGQPGQLNRAGYLHYAWFAAAAMIGCILLSAWGTQDRGRALVSNGPTGNLTGQSFAQGLRTVFLDGTYASLLGTSLSFSLAASIAVSLGNYLLTYFWKISATQLGTIAASNVLALILGISLVNLCKKRDKKKMTMLLLAATIVACSVLPLMGLLGLVSPESPVLLPLLVAQTVAASSLILALAILASSMGADVGEYFQLKTGRHIEGMMYSAGIMINKAVSGLGVFVTGAILDGIGFPAKAVPGQLDAQVTDGLGWACVGSICILCGISMACLWMFPIDRAAHRRILAQLKDRDAAGPAPAHSRPGADQ